MRKLILLTLLLLASFSMNAQSSTIRAFQLSIKFEGQPWSEWEQCNIPVIIDFDNKIVTIYSNVKQSYSILTQIDDSIDDWGKPIIMYNAIDQDGDHCVIKFRKLENVIQLYIHFSDVTWVYNLG